MKRVFYISILVLTSICLMSVSTDESDLLYKNVWSYSGKNYSFKNKRNFIELRDGYKFYKNGDLIFRTNLSWCGYGGPSFENCKGDWKYLTDSTIQIQYKIWNQWNTQKFKLTIIDKKNIEVIPISGIKVKKQKVPKPFLGE